MSTAPLGTGTRRARKRDTSALAVASALTGLLAWLEAAPPGSHFGVAL